MIARLIDRWLARVGALENTSREAVLSASIVHAVEERDA